MKTKLVLAFILLFFLFSFFSCQKRNVKDLEDENTYLLLNALVHESKEFLKIKIILPPPPPPLPYKENNVNISTRDSLKLYEYFYRESSKRKVIAIENNLFGIEEEYSFKDKCKIDEDLLDLFNSQKEERKIDVSKITDFNKDSIIQFKEEFSKLPLRGFKKMDLLLSFSRIAFNEEYNKAIVIVGELKGHLDGLSSLIYLEKENYQWKIKCSRVLSIS